MVIGTTALMRQYRKSVTIEITQFDIDAGVQRDWVRCPFALALARKAREMGGVALLVFWASDSDCEVRKFVEHFDNHGKDNTPSATVTVFEYDIWNDNVVSPSPRAAAS